MGWINTFLARRVFGAVAPADPYDDTTHNGVLNIPHEALRSDTEDPTVGRPDAQIPEEIKRRQIVLITRYVTMARGR